MGIEVKSVQPKPAEIPVSQDSNRLIALPHAEEIKPSQRIEVFTLAAGEERILPFEGNQFYVVTAATTVSIRAKGSTYNAYLERTGRKLASGFFSSLEIKNPGAAPVTVTLAVGNDDFLDKRIV